TFSCRFSHFRDEDVVQARLDHLKLTDNGTRIDQTFQQCLCVSSGSEQRLRFVSMTHEFTDERRIVQHTVATFAAHGYRIPSKAALDLTQTSFEHFPRTIEQTDVVA